MKKLFARLAVILYNEVRQLGFQVTFARGAEWAASGKVTLPIPAELAQAGASR
jgi:hypothetical protein